MPTARLFAVYIDHRLRPRRRVAADIAAVRAQARHARAKVIVRAIAVPRRGVSIEAAARERRYAELARVAGQVGATTVITGHHRDDLAETALLALVRGSGLDGLSAMNETMALAPGITLRRPLLTYSKAQLVELLRAAGVPAAQDETNQDLNLRRNAIRALLRELERVAPGSSRAIARSAALLAGDKKVLGSLAAVALERAKADGATSDLSARALRALPPALLRRVLRLAVRRNLGSLDDFDSRRCLAIARAVVRGQGGLFPGRRDSYVEISAGRVSFHARLPARSTRKDRSEIAPPASVIVVPKSKAVARDTAGLITMRRVDTRSNGARKKYAAALDAASLPAGTTLTLRTARAGDKCVPSGRHRPVPLRKFLAKAGVPNSRRGEVLLLCHGSEIVAAIGVRVMEPHAPRGREVLAVNIMKGAQG
jgi:tRNA(Ile)-lysidine synthase